MAPAQNVVITAGPFKFRAVFEIDAPKTVEAFRRLMPYHQKLVHVRWSGEGLWVPLGNKDFGISFENHTSHPSAGQILLYPGGYSETELLFCYGGVSFASKMGPLAANHFLTIWEGNENLKALGEMVLWKGAQDVTFEIVDDERYVARQPVLYPNNTHLLVPLRPLEIPRNCPRLSYSLEQPHCVHQGPHKSAKVASDSLSLFCVLGHS